MGASFDVDHANFVAYLTAEGPTVAPRAENAVLKAFLDALAEGQGLISSTMGTRDDWTREVAHAAAHQLHKLPPDNRILESNHVSEILHVLRAYFTGYSLYAMVIASSETELGRRSFVELAINTQTNALILFPKLRSSNIMSVVDPFPALRVIAESSITPPLIVFWTSDGNSCVIRLDEAMTLFREDLANALESGAEAVHELIAAARVHQKAKRILHLSDLHFGTNEASLRRRWLKEQLRRELTSVDRVVVTGDMFDSPDERLRESFDEFRLDIEELTKDDVLVIPGNHDVRMFGNAVGGLGRNSRYAADLRWDPIVVDHNLQVVFFSFNSSEEGDFARGMVGERQRLDRGTLFDVALRRDPSVSRYVRIALVHHHPYSYGSEPTTAYERIIAKLLGGEERFVAFEGADKFMSWCAARGIALVLHGHKHVPHWVEAEITVQRTTRSVLVVGCGSATVVGNKPMCYDIITINPFTKRCNVLFYHDESGDGSGFVLQNITLDLRRC